MTKNKPAGGTTRFDSAQCAVLKTELNATTNAYRIIRGESASRLNRMDTSNPVAERPALSDVEVRRSTRAMGILMVVALLVLSVSCRRHSYDIAPDTIRFHLPQDPILLNPVVAEDAYSNIICARIFESLLERDRKTLQLKGMIAETFTIGADKLTYTFNLRRDVRFHDGKVLTADDVLFSYNTMMSEKIPNAHKKVYYKDVLSISAPDAHTIVFRMKRPYAMALEHLGGFEIIPKHIYSVGDFMKDDRNLRGPIGTGPFRFVEWTTGQRVLLAHFADYWGVKPEIHNIEFSIIKNDAVALQALKKGDIDSYNLKPLQWTRQTQSEKFKSDFHKIKYLATSYRYVGYNMRREPFNDRRVRTAMAHLMDLQRMRSTILENLAEVTTGPFLLQSLQYNHDLVPLGFDPQKALALLAEAGYKPDPNGLIARAGKPLEIELMIPAGGGFYDQFVSVIKEDFSRYGITINPRKLEFQTLLTKINQRDFQAVMLGWSSGIESDPYQLWHTSQRDKGHNFTGFGNAESDGLIEQARLTFDDKARNAIYHRFHKLVYDEQPYTFLYTGYALIAVSKRFTNVNVYPLGLDLMEWKLASQP
jgi:peptide/nickel transport system substrate-binding protein